MSFSDTSVMREKLSKLSSWNSPSYGKIILRSSYFIHDCNQIDFINIGICNQSLPFITNTIYDVILPTNCDFRNEL